MYSTDKAKQIFEILKVSSENNDCKEQLSFAAFVVGLLPIPGIQQAAQYADRILSDKILNTKLQRLWEEIRQINRKIDTITNDIEKLNEILGTIRFNKSLNKKVKELMNVMVREFKLETTDWSYQELLNCTVDTDFASITANNNSVNKIENSQINSQQVLLQANNGSLNYFNETKFTGPTGSVGMNGTSTRGNLAVKDASMVFTPGSAVTFIAKK